MQDTDSGSRGGPRHLLLESWRQSPDLHCVATVGGRFEAVNPSLAEPTGHAVTPVLRMSYPAFVQADDHQRVFYVGSRLAEGGAIGSFSCQLLAADGTWRWFDWTATVVPARDVIVAQGRQMDLGSGWASPGHQLEAVLESVRDGIVTMDAHGRIRSSNGAVGTLFGHEIDELVGKSIRMLLDEPDRSGGAVHAWKRRGSGPETIVPKRREVRWRTKDGAISPLELTVTEFALKSGENVFTGGMRDLTERKVLERRLGQRSDALAEANDDLQWVICALSHELRVPLFSVDGFSTMLLWEQARRLGEEDARRVGLILGTAKHMSYRIEDLLALSGTGHGEIRRRRCDVTAIAAEVARDVHDGAGGSVALTIELGMAVAGDSRPIRQVVANLLGNASKFAAGQPRPAIEIGQMAHETEDIIYVRNNGVGFDQEQAADIFRPFRRLHRGTEFEGTGIGLAIVNRIIERHNCRVWAHAEPGAGATFLSTLPRSGDEHEA